MDQIKFGTDGWRAIIAKEFTNENVARITQGVCNWLQKESKQHKKVVVGYDCRFGGKQFLDVVAQVLLYNGVEVVCHETPITTPAISYATKKLSCDVGIILTASHNPATYNGYKLKGSYGGPLLPDQIKEIEAVIPDQKDNKWFDQDLSDVKTLDLKELYLDQVRTSFDIQGLNNAPLGISYDAMFGSGQFVFRALFPNADLFRCEWNPHFYGINPEPIEKNLGAYQLHLSQQNGVDIGLVNDGDADRIGLLAGDGTFIDSHNIMLLLLHYLHNYKGLSGKVATGFSSTEKIKTFCAMHNLDLTIVPIGFKHICGLMLEHDVLLGGEESGGIAVAGHIPERDGIWNGLLLMQFMMETGKSLKELLDEVKALVGNFYFKRVDLKLSDDIKNEVVEKCRLGQFDRFGAFEVQRMEDLDGWKYYLSDEEWVMIRPSGTEPVLRIYAEGQTEERTNLILRQCQEAIL